MLLPFSDDGRFVPMVLFCAHGIPSAGPARPHRRKACRLVCELAQHGLGATDGGSAMPIRFLCAILLALAAAMLAVPARAASDPPLVPLGAFFANPKAAWEHRVSPDGARLAWVAMHKGRATLHFRRLEEAVARTVETARELRPPWGGS